MNKIQIVQTIESRSDVESVYVMEIECMVPHCGSSDRDNRMHMEPEEGCTRPDEHHEYVPGPMVLRITPKVTDPWVKA